jgi:hypothetical protein
LEVVEPSAPTEDVLADDGEIVTRHRPRQPCFTHDSDDDGPPSYDTAMREAVTGEAITDSFDIEAELPNGSRIVIDPTGGGSIRTTHTSRRRPQSRAFRPTPPPRQSSRNQQTQSDDDRDDPILELTLGRMLGFEISMRCEVLVRREVRFCNPTEHSDSDGSALGRPD